VIKKKRIMEKKVKKSFKLQAQRLTKVLEDLEALDVELLEHSEDGNGFIINDVLSAVIPKIYQSIQALEQASVPSNLLDQTQELSPWVAVTGKYKDQDVSLWKEVNRVMIGYPFEADGEQEYDIKPVTSLSDLVSEVQKVVVREYNAGNSTAPHVLEDFWIELISVRNDNCADVYIGS
jgi:hypothetical protein